MKYNKNFDLLAGNYLFAEIAARTSAYKSKNPEVRLVNLGIGDVRGPLVPAIIEAGQKAVLEMAEKSTFRGYGDYEGYEFLRTAIVRKYGTFGADVNANEIFVGDGAKSDMAQILRLFNKSTALIPNPVYPAYLDTNIIAGNTVIFAEGNRQNSFLPMPDGRQCDLIYLCSPSNPTGGVYSREQLDEWVDFAKSIKAIILFDAAYEAYIDGDYPHSIFEIDGAKECAIEFNSLSKSAGFTGVRCGWTIIPSQLKANKLWMRYRSASYNGTPYIVQRMAEAALSGIGQLQISRQIAEYKQKARDICTALDKLGVWYTGGISSPYVWLECKQNSWEFFDKLLDEMHIVGVPGSGFGSAGEGYFRLSSFGG